MIKHCLVLGGVLLLASCSKPDNSGLITQNFNTDVRPQDNLYEHVNGTWLKEFDIPSDKSSYGSFTKLHDDAQKNLKAIIEESANKTSPKGSDQQKVGDLYLSYMDTASIERVGISPLKPYLSKIANISSKKELTPVIAELGKIGVSTPIALWVGADAKKSDEYIVNIYQSGLSLPDKSYYEKNSLKFVDIRSTLVYHITQILTFANIEDAANKAQKVLDIETQIAASHWTRTENRDRNKTYNKRSVDVLNKESKAIDWTAFLAESGLPNAKEIRVYQPSFFSSLDQLTNKIALEDWKTYYTWHLLKAFSPTLGKRFDEENFAFFGQKLSGVRVQSERWKRAVSKVNRAIGEIVGKVYVSKHFKPEAKARMNKLIDNLVLAFEQRIKGLSWMGEETKKQALDKLSKFTRKIGYPDKWKDYSALSIEKDQITKNIIAANIWSHNYNIEKFGKPIYKHEWFMNPQRVNAYYNSSANEIVFPAAILQPPFFNMEADDAVNYGAIGAVIGHEISHGFDDQGAKSDGDGNLRDWWTETDKTQFETLGNRLVDQYETYIPIDSMHINGRLTLGENIGDLGGLTVAYHAYKNSLKGKKSPVINGTTGEQRVFMGWAQIWASKYRDEALRNRLLTNTHSPGEYRTNGVVVNMPEFEEAFGLKESDKLYKKPEDRIIIW